MDKEDGKKSVNLISEKRQLLSHRMRPLLCILADCYKPERFHKGSSYKLEPAENMFCEFHQLPNGLLLISDRVRFIKPKYNFDFPSSPCLIDPLSLRDDFVA